MKIILLLVLFAGSLWAAKIPDGAWNGKPWDRHQLLTGVKNGDADALAEWAYCSRRGMLQIPYDAKLIYRRAKTAGEKGSVAGKRLAAKCLKIGTGVEPSDGPALKMLMKLAEQGCPDAKIDVAYEYMGGASLSKDLAQAERLVKEARASGSVRAVDCMTVLYQKQGNHDRRKHLELKVRAFLLSKDVFTANGIYYELVYGNKRTSGEILTKEVFSKAREVIEEGLLLNHPSAYFTQSYYELDTPGGNVHRGVMLQVKAANLGHASAMKNLTRWLNQGYKDDYDGQRQLLATGNWKDAQKTAKFAYDRGVRNFSVVLSYARQLSMTGGKGPQKKRQLAEKLLKQQIIKGDCNAHDVLGLQHIQEYQKYGGTETESNLGFAHLIYHSHHSPYSPYLLILFYSSDKSVASHDLVKGAAVSKYYLEKFTKRHRVNEIQLAKKWNSVTAQFTDKQKKEYQRLVNSGFPASEQYRRPAYELLKKSGELPPNWKFDQ